MRTGSRWGRGVAAAALALAACVSSGMPSLAGPGDLTGGSSARLVAVPGLGTATSGQLNIVLGSLAPAIITPGQKATVTATLTNTGTEPMVDLTVRLRVGRQGLGTPAEVDGFDPGLTGTPQPAWLPSVAAQDIGDLSPGASATVTLTASTLTLPSATVGVLPLAVEGSYVGGLTWARTYLPYQRAAHYQPLKVGVVVPLTATQDVRLYADAGTRAAVNGSVSSSTTSAEAADIRTAAWRSLIGPGSRIDELVTGGGAAPVTWAVDPELLGAGVAMPAVAAKTTATPSAGTPAGAGAPTSTTTPSGSGADSPPSSSNSSSSSSSSSSETPTPTAPTEVDTLQARLAGRLSPRELWRLPTSDPDLSGLVATKARPEFLASLVKPTKLSGSAALLNDERTVLWPVGVPLDVDARTAAASAVGADALSLAPLDTLHDTVPLGASVTHRDTSGVVLGWNSRLSDAFAASGTTAGVVTRQRLLAESAVALLRAPGVARTTLVAAPRGFSASAAALRSTLQSLSATPWLRLVPVGQLASDAASPVTRTEPLPDTEPDGVPASPLKSATTADAEAQRRVVAGLATSMGSAGVGTLPDRTAALVSTRYRGDPTGHARDVDAVRHQTAALRAGVHVVESTVNFFADSGYLQVTVVNDLGVNLADVNLSLSTSDRQTRLKILSQPEPVDINRSSRTTVRVPVEALTAGRVTVSTTVTTPAGTRLGPNGTISVQVQPTNGWVVLAVGGLALVVFVAGLFRALRVGRPRATAAEIKELDLT